MNYSLPKIVTIEGPTAVGKSNFAHKLSTYFPAEIISADSRQIYRHLDIGTAKPDKATQDKYCYHGIDLITPDQKFDSGKFIQYSDDQIKIITSKEKIPLIVGGTGFYIQSLLRGLFHSPEIPISVKNRLNKRYEKVGFDVLYKELEEIDSESALRIAKNDKNRLLRAIEIWEVTGKTISDHWKKQQKEKQFDAYRILLTQNREILYNKINKRVEKMIDLGLLDEFDKILNLGYNSKDFGMNTVGYKELFSLRNGERNLVDTINLIQKNTRNYAKRQFTWYKKQDFDLTIDPLDINFSVIVKNIQNWFTKEEREV